MGTCWRCKWRNRGWSIAPACSREKLACRVTGLGIGETGQICQRRPRGSGASGWGHAWAWPPQSQCAGLCERTNDKVVKPSASQVVHPVRHKVPAGSGQGSRPVDRQGTTPLPAALGWLPAPQVQAHVPSCSGQPVVVVADCHDHGVVAGNRAQKVPACTRGMGRGCKALGGEGCLDTALTPTTALLIRQPSASLT